VADVSLARAPVDPGCADRLREWFAELHDREDEVVATLRHERVYTESAFLHATDDGTYLYVFMEAVDLDAADAAGDEEAHDVDAEHHAVLRETLAGPFERLETIGHFTNPDLR